MNEQRLSCVEKEKNTVKSHKVILKRSQILLTYQPGCMPQTIAGAVYMLVYITHS